MADVTARFTNKTLPQTDPMYPGIPGSPMTKNPNDSGLQSLAISPLGNFTDLALRTAAAPVLAFSDVGSKLLNAGGSLVGANPNFYTNRYYDNINGMVKTAGITPDPGTVPAPPFKQAPRYAVDNTSYPDASKIPDTPAADPNGFAMVGGKLINYADIGTTKDPFTKGDGSGRVAGQKENSYDIIDRMTGRGTTPSFSAGVATPPAVASTAPGPMTSALDTQFNRQYHGGASTGSAGGSTAGPVFTDRASERAQLAQMQAERTGVAPAPMSFNSNISDSVGTGFGFLGAMNVAAKQAEASQNEAQTGINNAVNFQKLANETELRKAQTGYYGAHTKLLNEQANLESLKASNPAEYLRRTGQDPAAKAELERSQAAAKAYDAALTASNGDTAKAEAASAQAATTWDAIQKRMKYVPGTPGKKAVLGGLWSSAVPATPARFAPADIKGYDKDGNPVR